MLRTPGLVTSLDFGNVIHIPILKGDSNDLVVYLLPPPELHLLIGPVNTMFGALEKVWPDVLKWAALCHVEREAIHGGSFNGNSSRKLLKKTDALESHIPPEHKNYVCAFRSFNKVVASCYGQELITTYKDDIAEFKKILGYDDLKKNTH